MTKNLLCTICLLLLAHSAYAQTYRAPLEKIELENGDSLVFFGDSITHQCLYTQYVEDYFYTRYPGRRIHFHNSGVSGDKCDDALIRFEQDVTPYQPKYVTVLLGMNDGAYRPFDQEKFDLYEKGMIQVVEKIQAIGATPILMTPTMYDARAARMANDGSDNPTFRHYNSVIAYYGALLREISYRRGLGFVDIYSPLNNITLEQRKKDPQFTLIKDSVHPGVAGQVVMAAAVLDSLHSQALVSSIHVQIGEGSVPKITAHNGEAQEAKRVADGVTFSFLAKALPWVLPEEARLGFELSQAGQRFSREQVRVTGLPPGDYQMSIDGQEVGIYPHLDLAHGIELQANPKTPQYQQSLGVAMINKERNEKAYKRIRDLWWTKKLMRVTAEKVAAEPANQKAKADLEQLESQHKDIGSQLDELLAKAKEYEASIYQANQPKLCHYQISKKN
jgi:lysophospholipase L1-like esterase